MILNQPETYDLEQKNIKSTAYVECWRYLSLTIPDHIKQNKSNQSYNFSSNTTCFDSGMIGNMADVSVYENSCNIQNIILGLYDLSMRIPLNKLKQKYLDLVTSYISRFGISELINSTNYNPRHFIINKMHILRQHVTLISKCFFIDQDTQKDLKKAFAAVDLAYRTYNFANLYKVKPSKLSTLDDFIYRAPDSNEVEDRIRQFHSQYENLNISQDTFIQNPLWIIHTFYLPSRA